MLDDIICKLTAAIDMRKRTEKGEDCERSGKLSTGPAGLDDSTLDEGSKKREKTEKKRPTVLKCGWSLRASTNQTDVGGNQMDEPWPESGGVD